VEIGLPSYPLYPLPPPGKDPYCDQKQIRSKEKSLTLREFYIKQNISKEDTEIYFMVEATQKAALQKILKKTRLVITPRDTVFFLMSLKGVF